MLTYEVHKENEFSRVFYTGDDALKFINDNKYKIDTLYYAGYDIFVIEVIK